MSKKINESLPKKFRLGQVGVNNQDLKMTIKAYRNNKDIDVQFEDGAIVEHKAYNNFLKGSIAHPIKENLGILYPQIAQMIVNDKRNNITMKDMFEISPHSHQYFYFKCNKCEKGSTKRKQVGSIVENGYSCEHCSDKISIPNKILRQISEQLELNLKFEYSPKWLKRKRLDGYNDSLRIAIEMDGGYGNHEDKTIDNWKDRKCLEHGIYTIRIDLTNDNEYNKNAFEYIKRQILNSPLNQIYDLSNVDWGLAWENSLKNLVWEVKELYDEGYNNKQIAKELSISECTVGKYLRKLNIKTPSEIKQENILKTKELFDKGYMVKQIANELNVSTNTVGKYLRELGIKTLKEIKQENIFKTKELLNKGYTVKQIANELNVGRDTIWNYKKELKNTK